MKRTAALVLALVVSASIHAIAAELASDRAPGPRLKIVLVTGGHGFQAEPFFQVFKDNNEINVTYASQGKTNAPSYERDDLLAYDTVVLYDMPMAITEPQKAGFRSLFDRGIGLVVLHHSLVAYQHWPEYEEVVGGKYLTSEERSGDKVVPSSNYHEGLEVPIVIVATNHPITAGIHDFTIHDEIYTGVRVQPDVTPLFITTHELNRGRPMGWYRQQGKSRVVYLQLGHGPEAYSNPNYRRLLANSIRWAARQ